MGIQFSEPARRLIRATVLQELAAIHTTTPADPFHLDHDCAHPEGHDAVMIGRSFVCVNCSRVFE